MRVLYLMTGISLLLATGIGLAYISLPVPSVGAPESRWVLILADAFKATLIFAVITGGGTFLKSVVDQVLERQRARRSTEVRFEEIRRSILERLAEVHSQFYSVRKLYHSARSSHNNIYSPQEKEFIELTRDLLKESVDLEGQFGALKILAISHFGLPTGDFGFKDSTQLESRLAETEDSFRAARLRLDLLGEGYDDWRHAIEENRKIVTSEALWSSYEALIDFLQSQTFEQWEKRRTQLLRGTTGASA